MNKNVTISHGFSQQEAEQVTRLFWAAFHEKLKIVLGPADKALQFLRPLADPKFAICARDANGRLLGVAGFKTAEGALIGGNLHAVQRVYGRFGGLWRSLFLAVLEREIEDGQLLMDGIFVEPNARGQGIGTKLLAAIAEYAKSNAYETVRLDVIDTNPRARALYERHGFFAEQTANIWPFNYIFGFRNSTTMVLNLNSP